MANRDSMLDSSYDQENILFGFPLSPGSPSDSGGSMDNLDMDIFPDLAELERNVTVAAGSCTKDPKKRYTGEPRTIGAEASQDQELVDYLTGKYESRDTDAVADGESRSRPGPGLGQTGHADKAGSVVKGLNSGTLLKFVKTDAGGPPVLVKVASLTIPPSGQLTVLTSKAPADSSNTVRGSEMQASCGSSEHPSLSKNAVAARENRKRKKQYIEMLEKQTRQFQEENHSLKEHVAGLTTNVKNLETEVAYLKEVLANQSTLSALIGNIQNTPGVQFTTSLPMQEHKENKKKQFDHTLENVKPTETNDGRLCAKSASKSDEMKRSEKKKTEVNISNAMCTRAKGKRLKLDLQKDHSYCESKVTFTSVDSRNSCATESSGGGGVCLHVSDGCVSLEFCADCSAKASSAKKKTRK